jgi:hypothetical protein
MQLEKRVTEKGIIDVSVSNIFEEVDAFQLAISLQPLEMTNTSERLYA